MDRNLKIEEIVKLYPELAEDSDAWIVGTYEGICNSQLMFEFVTQTIASKLVISQLLKRFNNIGKTGVSKNKNTIVVKHTDANKLDDINKFMDAMGWYPAHFSFGGKYNPQTAKNKIPADLVYEPKYDVQIDISQLGKYLYHVTPDINYTDIKIFGLTPKSHTKLSNHPERIYLLKTKNKIDYIIKQLFAHINPDVVPFIKKYYILQIETSKLKNYKIFNDPNFHIGDGAVWVFEPIPANAIKVVGTQIVNKFGTGTTLQWI